MMRKTLILAALGATTAIASPAMAQSAIYLDFEGIATYPTGQGTTIGSYYNGGAAGNGKVGPNYGVIFSSGAQLLCLNTASTNCSNTSKGGLGIPTSQFYALYFPNTNPTMNVAAGFNNGFAFTYSAPYTTSTVNIWSGLDGTGTLLASASLPLTANAGCSATISAGANYCPFNPFSVGFTGMARSVVFGGTVNQQVFDDFTFGSTVVGGAVPEPATWAMMLCGFGLVGFAMRRRSSVRNNVSFA